LATFAEPEPSSKNVQTSYSATLPPEEASEKSNTEPASEPIPIYRPSEVPSEGVTLSAYQDGGEQAAGMEIPIVQPRSDMPVAGSPLGRSGSGSGEGYFNAGPTVQGQILNPAQQTASERAVALLGENKILRQEIQRLTKANADLQQQLNDRDTLWAEARNEFAQIRENVDQLNNENVQLHQQNESLTRERDQIAAEYDKLVNSVGQTLDDLLMKAISDPSQNKPAEQGSPK
jgi:hypothetical protein